MKTLNSSAALTCLVVALATVTRALRQPLGTFIDVGPPWRLLQLKLWSCDGTCTCWNACGRLAYNSGRLQCELVPPQNQTSHSLYFEERIAYLTDDTGHPVSHDATEPTGRYCSSLDLLVCPHLVTNDSSVVLDNLTTIIKDQRLVQFTWSHGQDGWNTDSCTAYSESAYYSTHDRME